MASFLSSTRIQKEEPREVFFDSPSFINQNSTIQASSCYTPNRAQNGSTTVMENRPSGQIEQALLKSSIYDKCQALGLALKDNNNMKELERLYPIIVQKIFGFGSYPPGWGIQTLHRTKSRKDSEALLDFLSPTGPLFTHLIYKLLAEPLAFNFPKGFIPESTKRKLDEGMQVTDMFHKDRFMFSDQLSEAVLPLDAFQYYFFIFAHKMVDSTTKTQELYLEPGDWVYPTLLNSYLQFFLPMTGVPDQPSYSPYYMKSQQQATPRVSYVQPRSNYRIKSEPTTSFILGLKQPKTTTPTNEAHVLWRSEKLMQILAEFWMSQSSLDIDNYSYVVKTMSLPSHDLIMLVRMVVKHVHSFIHALDNNVLPSHLQNPETVMGSFKRSLLGSCLQKPLYSFLRHTIEKWPLDTSFRPILETWLTYIRPWRYAASGGNESRQSAGDEESKPVDFSLWDEFVRGNSLFYTVLFQDMLTRFHRIDLTASKMAFQLSRVCKVFNEPQLIDKLRQVDLSMTEFISAYHNHTITGDVTGGLIERTRALLDNQIINLEASNFVCRPMFCDDVMQMGANLLQELVNSQYKVRKAMNKIGEKSKPSKGPSLLSFLGLEQIADFNEAISGNANKEYESTQKCIEQCIGDLSQIFQLELPDCDLSSSTDTLTDTGSEDLPDHVTKADGRVELTTLGRYQLLNGMRRFPNIDYQGDPELQPVRSFESDIAVTQLYKLSSKLNNKYGDWFNEQYNQGGIKGSIAKRVLDLPPRTVCASKPRPRLSLRFLANYYFLGYSLVAYLVLSTLLGRLPTIVLVILCLLFYILTMSLIDLWNSR